MREIFGDFDIWGFDITKCDIWGFNCFYKCILSIHLFQQHFPPSPSPPLRFGPSPAIPTFGPHSSRRMPKLAKNRWNGSRWRGRGTRRGKNITLIRSEINQSISDRSINQPECCQLSDPHFALGQCRVAVQLAHWALLGAQGCDGAQLEGTHVDITRKAHIDYCI